MANKPCDRLACLRSFPSGFSSDNRVGIVAPGETTVSSTGGGKSWEVLTPYISDQVSIPDGVVGEVAEILCRDGDTVRR